MFVLKETTVNSAELLSTELFSAEPVECIGYGKTDAAPPWIMIGLAAVFMLFGVGLAAGFTQRREEFLGSGFRSDFF